MFFVEQLQADRLKELISGLLNEQTLETIIRKGDLDPDKKESFSRVIESYLKSQDSSFIETYSRFRPADQELFKATLDIIDIVLANDSLHGLSRFRQDMTITQRLGRHPVYVSESRSIKECVKFIRANDSSVLSAINHQYFIYDTLAMNGLIYPPFNGNVADKPSGLMLSFSPYFPLLRPDTPEMFLSYLMLTLTKVARFQVAMSRCYKMKLLKTDQDTYDDVFFEPVLFNGPNDSQKTRIEEVIRRSSRDARSLDMDVLVHGDLHIGNTGLSLFKLAGFTEGFGPEGLSLQEAADLYGQEPLARDPYDFSGHETLKDLPENSFALILDAKLAKRHPAYDAAYFISTSLCDPTGFMALGYHLDINKQLEIELALAEHFRLEFNKAVSIHKRYYSGFDLTPIKQDDFHEAYRIIKRDIAQHGFRHYVKHANAMNPDNFAHAIGMYMHWLRSFDGPDAKIVAEFVGNTEFGRMVGVNPKNI